MCMEQKNYVLFKEFVLLVLTFVIGAVFWFLLEHEHTITTSCVSILATLVFECGIIGALSHGLTEKQIPAFKLFSVCCLVFIGLVMLTAVVYWDLYFLLLLLVFVGMIAGVICAVSMINLNYLWESRGYYHPQKSTTIKPKFADLNGYPVWHGNTPEKADDFAVPRYVYENLTETKKPTPKNGKIIGYRIGPELVIRSAITPAKGWQKEDIKPFIEHFGGKLLNCAEANILRHYWDTISEMRQAVGEPPLPVPYFWYEGEYGLASGHYRNDLNEIDPTESAIILKFC